MTLFLSLQAEAILRELVTITLRTDLTRTQRTSLETCITVHMHQKEVWHRHCSVAWQGNRCGKWARLLASGL